MYRPFRRFGVGLRPKQTILKYRHVARVRSFLRDIERFLRNYVTVHQSLVVLTVFILITNSIVVQAANAEGIVPAELTPLDPYKIADTVRIISPYMSDFVQDPDLLVVSLIEQDTGSFIAPDPLLATLPGQTDEPVAPVVVSPSKVARTTDTNYTVQIGDTLSQVGEKFDLKLATLRVKNNLSDIDAIKPGQVLVIPPQDLSDKAIKAADDRRKASLAFTQGTAKVSSAKVGGYGFIVPIKHRGVSRRLVAGHTGVDYMADTGTPVYAADDGVVASAGSGWNGGFGNNVLLSHGRGMTTRYAHLSRYVVGTGDTISQGELIGYSGNTGRSTGPHLHFELRINGVARDPGV